MKFRLVVKHYASIMRCENGTISCLHGFCDSSGTCICDEGFAHDFSWVTVRNCSVHQATAHSALTICGVIAVLQIIRTILTWKSFEKVKGTARHILYASLGFAFSTVALAGFMMAFGLHYSWFMMLLGAVYATIGYYTMTCVVRVSVKVVAMNSHKELLREKKLHNRMVLICKFNFILVAIVATVSRELIDEFLDESYQIPWMAGILFFNNFVQATFLYTLVGGLNHMASGLQTQISGMDAGITSRRLQDLLDRVRVSKKENIALCGMNGLIFFLSGIGLIASDGSVPYSFWLFFFAMIINPLLSSFAMYYFILAKKVQSNNKVHDAALPTADSNPVPSGGVDSSATSSQDSGNK